MYLIKFTYEYYCQGFETTQEYALVKAASPQEAYRKIKERYEGARDFYNLTIE